MQKIRNWNAGGPVESAHNLRVLDKSYPATGEVIAQIELADDQLLDETVRLAKSAQEKMGGPVRSGAGPHHGPRRPAPD